MAGWVKEKFTEYIKAKGITYKYVPEKTFYPSISFPAHLGELKHIYQNGLTMFDLINKFQKSLITVKGKPFYMYSFPVALLPREATFQFLWEDLK